MCIGIRKCILAKFYQTVVKFLQDQLQPASGGASSYWEGFTKILLHQVARNLALMVSQI